MPQFYFFSVTLPKNFCRCRIFALFQKIKRSIKLNVVLSFVSITTKKNRFNFGFIEFIFICVLDRKLKFSRADFLVCFIDFNQKGDNVEPGLHRIDILNACILRDFVVVGEPQTRKKPLEKL